MSPWPSGTIFCKIRAPRASVSLFHPATIILGNKIDLAANIQVQETELAALAESFGYEYMLTSAFKDAGIEEAFDILVRKIESKPETTTGQAMNKRLKNVQKKKEKKCC